MDDKAKEFDGGGAESMILQELKELVPPQQWSKMIELVRQFSIVSQVHFRITQIGYPYAEGSWLDRTGDLSLLQCIRTLPTDLQEKLSHSLTTLTRMATESALILSRAEAERKNMERIFEGRRKEELEDPNGR